MKHLTSTPEQRLNQMIQRASRRIEQIQRDPEYVKRIPFLSLCDILDLFLRQKLPPQDMDFVAKQLTSSVVVQQIVDLLIDATLWAKSEEGQKYLESLKKSALS